MKDNIPERVDRRKFVTLLGATGTVAIAGCSDAGEEPEDVGQEGQEETDEGGIEETEEGGTEETEEGGTEETEEGGIEETEEGGTEESHELRIIVEDSAGEPVEGASVEVEDEDGMSALEEDSETDANETDADGEFVAELPDGEYTVHVRADGFAEAEEQISIEGDDEELVVVLEDDTNGTNGTDDDITINGTDGDDTNDTNDTDDITINGTDGDDTNGTNDTNDTNDTDA